MAEERMVAGLWCSDVLARLSDYVDGELTKDEREHVDAHLRECDWCETFGGKFAKLVAGLRTRLAEPQRLDAGIEERLRATLSAGMAGD